MTEPTDASATDDLKEAVADLIGCRPEDVAEDDNLVLLGIGSLEVMCLATRWRRAGLVVDFGRLISEPTVRSWVAALQQAEEAGDRDQAAGAVVP